MLKVYDSLEIIVMQLSDQWNSANNLWLEISELEIIKNFTEVAEWHICNFSTIITCFSEHPNSLILIDLSISLDIQQSISKICDNYSLIHIVYQRNSKYLDKSTYSFAPLPSGEIEAFFLLLNYFNWNEGVIFLDEDSYSLKYEISDFSSEFDYFTIASLSNIDDLISGPVVRAGKTLYYLWLKNQKSKEVQKLLIKEKLLTSGSGIILNQESGYQCEIDGALIIAEKGHEYDNSFDQYLKSSIEKIISLVIYAEDMNEIKKLLDLELKSRYNSPEYLIINIQKGERVIVGSIANGKVSISSNLVFLGPSNIIPKSSQKVLPISINAGITNPGSENDFIALISSYGSNICLDKINDGHDILSNFKLEMFNFDCGVSIYDPAFLKSCYTKDIDKLGLAHISGHGSSVAIGSLLFFKRANITIPSVGHVNGSPLLSSITDFPMYVRMINPFAYNTCFQFIRAMGWRKMAIIYANSTLGLSVYSIVMNIAKVAGIEVVNSESARMMPPELDRGSIKEYKYVFEEVSNSRARLVLMLIHSPMCLYALEELYDAGLRRGDIYVLTSTWEIFNIITTNDDFLHKRLETGASMTTFLFSSWVGEVGKYAYNSYLNKYKKEPFSYACAYYDAAYFIAKALDYMITRGHNYSDPHKLMSTIRLTKFDGCMGSASIESGSNDRNFQMYTIQSFKVDQNWSTLIYTVGYLKPFSTNIIYILNPLIYPDGSSAKPSDLRENGECPFSDRDIQTFAKGRGLMVGLSLIFLFISSAITYFIWQKCWKIPVEDFKAKQEMSIEDLIVAVIIAIEFLQFTFMGPYLLPSKISIFISLSTLDLDGIFKLKNGGFYIVVDIILGLIGIWVISCAIILKRDRWEGVRIFRNLCTFAENLMPILGNICFMPFISVCLDVFLCDESIGDSFKDSFLAKDCYEFCWQDSHIVYSIISFLALLVYELLAVLYRPLWQELKENLHVKAMPCYLMVKSVLQTLLVVLAKTLKRSSNITHGVIFIVLMIAYIAIILKIKSYNYGRFHLWQVLGLVAVVWLALVSIFYLGIQGIPIAYYILISFGWSIIALSGLYLQIKKFPSLFYSKKEKNMWNLFRFAFTLSSTAYEIEET